MVKTLGARSCRYDQANLNGLMKPPALRKCSKCSELKPRKDFHTLNPKGELHPWCKECQRRYMAVQQLSRNSGGKDKLKQCSQCELSFSPQSFHWLKSTRTYHSYCRGCHATYMGLRYHLTKPKARAGWGKR